MPRTMAATLRGPAAPEGRCVSMVLGKMVGIKPLTLVQTRMHSYRIEIARARQ